MYTATRKALPPKKVPGVSASRGLGFSRACAFLSHENAAISFLPAAAGVVAVAAAAVVAVAVRLP